MSCKSNTGASASASNKQLQIPFKLVGNVIMLPVRVNHSREFKVILDTGMHFDGLLLYNIGPEDSIALKTATQVLVPGAGGDSPSTALMADSMSFFVGALECKDQRIIILQDDRLRGISSEGVVGFSLFGKYIVQVDYDRMIITLHESGIELDSSWTLLAMTFKENNIPWINGAVDINGGEEIPVSLYIDLASPDALELLIKEEMKFSLPLKLEDAYLGTGLSGDIHGQKGRISSLKLGPFYLKDVLTAFAPAEIRSKQENADGVIGNNSLRRFNVIFDYKGKKLYLKPNEYFSEPF